MCEQIRGQLAKLRECDSSLRDDKLASSIADIVVAAGCVLLPIAVVETQKVFVRARLDHAEA
ncbi:MAG TPA: hypothetical protein VEU30_16740 [Thermoanaerobaculia bacterium]|nr:hypothetical protein [Thermoanaerobaculia bacterium]